MDLVSVIVPVYNVERYLMRCVDSICKQSYKNLEIILVDDGSPDRCPEICEIIKNRDSRVKVVHKENGGLGLARNSGLTQATGTYVTFVDSDDWIAENHIENLYREAQKTGADAVIGSYTTVTSSGSIQNNDMVVQQKVYEGIEIKNEIVIPLIGADVTFDRDVQLEPSCCTNLYRLNIIRDKNILFPNEKKAVSEDVFFNVVFFCNARKVSVVDEMGYYYFENHSSISRKYDSGRLIRTVCYYEEMAKCIERNNLQDKVGYRLDRTFLMDIRVLLRMIVLSDIPRREKYEEIRKVLEHKLVKDVLLTYPVKTYNLPMRILAIQMQRGNTGIVCSLIRIYEYGRRRLWLKSMIKRFCVGR